MCPDRQNVVNYVKGSSITSIQSQQKMKANIQLHDLPLRLRKKSTMNIRLTIVSVLAVCTALWAMPGIVHGQVQGGDLFASVNLGGTFVNGASPIYQYGSQYLPPAGTPGIFASGLDTPRGLAFDPVSGNLFVEINHTVDASVDPPLIQGSILKFTPAGLMSTFATAFPPDLFLNTLAADSAGNVFVAAANLSQTQATIYKITPDGTVSLFFSLPAGAGGGGMAFDSSGNLYMTAFDLPTDPPTGEILRFAPNGTQDSSPFVGPTNFPNTTGGQIPTGLAFDASGNLFVSTVLNGGGPGEIRKFDSNGAEITPRFATGLTNNPRGLAVDSAGNLFLAELGIPGPGTPGDILQFTPGGTKTVFASTNFGTKGNRGPELLAFTTGALAPPTTAVALVFPDATEPLTATVTYIPQDSVPPPPSDFELTGSINLTFDITTTTAPTPPIIIGFTVPPSLDVSTLKALHYENGNWVDSTIKQGDPNYPSNPASNTVYASVNSLSPFLVATFKFGAQVQQPINANGTSVFNAKRGVVPVAFTLTSDGASTCELPPATISVFRTSGGALGSIDEGVYLSKSDSGSNFRISNCQYVYNLAASSLGPGTYKAYISIGGSVAGSATFALK
jgi:sugar lactone lactonase YvrE